MKKGKAKGKIWKLIEVNRDGLTTSQIAVKVGVSPQGVEYNLKQLLNEGKIRRVGWLYKPMAELKAAEAVPIEEAEPDGVHEITKELGEFLDIKKTMDEILAEMRRKKTYQVTLKVSVEEVEDA